MENDVESDRTIRARNILMPWNKNNTFVILWGYGNESIKCDWSEHKIVFSNTEKIQVESIGGMIGLKDIINEYVSMDPNKQPFYTITQKDNILCDYLCKLGFEDMAKSPGPEFPGGIPNNLIGVAAYGYWVSAGGVSLYNGTDISVYFYGYGKRFLERLREKIEWYADLPENTFGELTVDTIKPNNLADIWKLEYKGMESYRILTTLFVDSFNMCYPKKRAKASKIFTNYVNIHLDKRDETLNVIEACEDRNMVAFYELMPYMDTGLAGRYKKNCEPYFGKVKRRAEELWYLGDGEDANL